MIDLYFIPIEFPGSVIYIDDFQLDTFSYSFDIEQYKYQNIEHYKIKLSEDDWNTVKDNITWDNKGVADYETVLQKDDDTIFRGLIQKKDIKTNHKTNMSSIITYSFLKLFEIHKNIGLTSGNYLDTPLSNYFETFKGLIDYENNCYNHIDIADSMPHTKSIFFEDHYESLKQFDWNDLENDSLNNLSDFPVEDEDWSWKLTGYMGYFFNVGDIVKLVVYANTIAWDMDEVVSCYSISYQNYYIINKTFILKGDEGNISSDLFDIGSYDYHLLEGVEKVLNDFGANITHEDIGPNDDHIIFPAMATNWLSYEMPFNPDTWNDGILGYESYDEWGTFWPQYLSSGEIEIVIMGELIPDNFVGGIPTEDYRDYNIWDTVKDILHIQNLKLDINNVTNPPTVIVKDMNEATESEEISSSDIIEKNTSYTNIEYKDKLELLGDGSFLLEKLNGTSEIKKQISLKIISDDYDLALGEGVTIDSEDYIIISTERDILGHTQDIEVLEL